MIYIVLSNVHHAFRGHPVVKSKIKLDNTHCWDFGLIFWKWSEILTFPPNWSELGILFHEKLEKLTFHMKLASIFAWKLRGTNPPMGCITTSLVTDLS